MQRYLPLVRLIFEFQNFYSVPDAITFVTATCFYLISRASHRVWLSFRCSQSNCPSEECYKGHRRGYDRKQNVLGRTRCFPSRQLMDVTWLLSGTRKKEKDHSPVLQCDGARMWRGRPVATGDKRFKIKRFGTVVLRGSCISVLCTDGLSYRGYIYRIPEAFSVFFLNFTYPSGISGSLIQFLNT